jgi:hypothetical protein
MSTSTDAILFYGYAFDDEDQVPWPCERDEDGEEEEEDWEDRWARVNGLLAPAEPYGDEPRAVETPARLLHQAYWAARRELATAAGVDVDIHGYVDCPMYLVAIPSTKRTAHRGDPVAVDALVVPEGADEQLHTFMAKMGIEKPPGQERPRWWLVSYWG